MRERVSGRLGCKPEEHWGPQDRHWVGFSLCVDGYEEGPVWYDVLCVGHSLSDFALRNLEKGWKAVVEGETEMKTWVDKKGESRVKRLLRAFILELPGGERAERGPEPLLPQKSKESVEAAYKARREEDLRDYPLRWDRAFKGEVLRDAKAAHPEAWEEAPASDPDALVPREEIENLMARLLGGTTGDRAASGG